MVPQTGGHAQFFSRDKSSVKKIGNENTIINTSDRRSRPIFSEVKNSGQLGTEKNLVPQAAGQPIFHRGKALFKKIDTEHKPFFIPHFSRDQTLFK